jgi:hypothetical protein
VTVTGPYLDYFCTGEYTITLSVPVRLYGRVPRRGGRRRAGAQPGAPSHAVPGRALAANLPCGPCPAWMCRPGRISPRTTHPKNARPECLDARFRHSGANRYRCRRGLLWMPKISGIASGGSGSLFAILTVVKTAYGISWAKAAYEGRPDAAALRPDASHAAVRRVVAAGRPDPRVDHPALWPGGTRSASGGGPGGVPSPNGLPPSSSRPCGVSQPDRSGPAGTIFAGFRFVCTR